MTPTTCALCGRDGYDVTVAIVRYRPSYRTGQLFESLPRCKDHQACWQRCVDGGDAWPIDDNRPPSRLLLA